MKIIIIGGGPAGYMGAIRASQLGMNVTLIEKDELGGTCLNRGCVPTKALLQAASVYNAVTKEAAEWGIETGVASVDTAKLYDKKINIVEQLRKGVKFLMDSNKIEVISGTAKVLPNMQVLIKESGVTIDADKILVCTGSVAARLPIPGIEYALSSDDVLSAPVEAKKIAIIGGGVIGVELALFFAKMGCEVTIYEYMSALVA
ncbi:MAG: FAD-dependent oxidoreductase, partial [Paludibacteraceae bacterium]|nr:FAD-dependent oxidoreductase [Paludibacteraceae bacterium]